MPGRIRSIKPEFYTDIVLIRLPDEVRLAFPGIWQQADREGRLEDKPDQLRVDIFPDQVRDMESIIQQLAEAGLLIRYQINGKRYIQVKNFLEHQRPNNREVVSVIPPPEGFVAHERPEDPPSETKEPEAANPVETEVLNALNELTGSTWIGGKGYGKYLRARIAEGKTIGDLLSVVMLKVAEWKESTEMHQYLNPKTLFRPENFERYLMEAKKPNSRRPHDRKRTDAAWEGQQEGEVKI